MFLFLMVSLLVSSVFAQDGDYSCKLINKTDDSIIKKTLAVNISGERRALSFNHNEANLPEDHRLVLIEILKLYPRSSSDFKFQHHMKVTVGSEILVVDPVSKGGISDTFIDVRGTDETPAEVFIGWGTKDEVPALLEAESERYRVSCSVDSQD